MSAAQSTPTPWSAATIGDYLLQQKESVAVPAEASEVVPPAAVGAHEMQPEAVQVGLGTGVELLELPVAADAVPHGASVALLVDALRRIAEYEGSPNTPVANSVAKSGIARAALARVGGA